MSACDSDGESSRGSFYDDCSDFEVEFEEVPSVARNRQQELVTTTEDDVEEGSYLDGINRSHFALFNAFTQGCRKEIDHLPIPGLRIAHMLGVAGPRPRGAVLPPHHITCQNRV